MKPRVLAEERLNCLTVALLLALPSCLGLSDDAERVLPSPGRASGMLFLLGSADDEEGDCLSNSKVFFRSRAKLERHESITSRMLRA